MYKDFMDITRGSKHIIDMKIDDVRFKNVTPVFKREVVRGIAVKDDKILLVYPKNNVLYGTPGGGIDQGETKEEALLRELKEEVGADKVKIMSYLGEMVSVRFNYGGEGVYSPTHHYFLVEIESFGNQELITYEEELELQFDYIDIDEAIMHNTKTLNNRDKDLLDFYTNQTEILKEIKEKIINKKEDN